ncbi:MAG: PAS domain S-box protein [Desulfarculus sp.]|nr:PAS domain S-box protein [Desulfarculus sp.]
MSSIQQDDDRIPVRERQNPATESEAADNGASWLGGLFEAAPVMMHCLDRQGRLVDVNRAWLAATGYSREEVLGETLAVLMDPETAKRSLEQDIARFWSQGRAEGVICTWRRKDGSSLEVAVDATVVAIPGGGEVGLWVVRDLARERALAREMDQRPRELEELLPFFELGQDLLCIADVEGRFKRVNPAFGRMLGLDAETLGERAYLDFVHPEDREATRAAMASLARGETVTGFLNRYRAEDGQYRWLAWNSASDLAEGLVYAVARDVTDLMLAQEALAERESTLAGILAAAPIGVGLVKDRVFVWVSDNFCRLTGYRPEEVIGQSSRLIYPDQEEFERAGRVKYQQLSRDGVGEVETRWVAKDGRVMDIKLRSAPLVPGRTEQGVIFTAEDVTARRAAERQARLLARFPLENPNPVMRFDAQGRCVFANPVATRLLGGKPGGEGLTLPPEVAAAAARALVDGQTMRLEQALDGSHYLFDLVPLPGEGLVNVYSLDVTSLHQTQQELRRARDQAQTYLDVAGVMMVALDTQGRVTMVNRKACQVLGYPESEILGRDWFAGFVPAAVRAQVRQVFDRLVGGEIELVEHYENPVLTADGQERLISWRNAYFMDERGGLLGALCSGEDITEARRMQERLRQSELQFRRAFDLVPIGMALVTPDTRLIQVNTRFAQQVGYQPQEMVGRSFEEFTHPEDRGGGPERLRRIAEGLEDFNQAQKRYLHRDGHVVWCRVGNSLVRDEKGNPVQFVSYVQDISEQVQAEAERRRLESQIQHAQKLESLGVLAGGIAHDFNNLLVAILGNADLALMDLPPESPARSRVLALRDTAIRASELSNQMLAYSGKGRFMVEALNLNRLVEEMANLLRVSIAKNVVLKFNFHPGLPLVEADAAQIRQVVMNLITNAGEAIGDKSGVVSLSTGLTEVDRDYFTGTFVDDDLPEGYYAYLEVSDTGQGMDAATRSRIFDPFFTTKFTGRGLGLSAVLGIVRGHRGAIKVYSEPGRGSSFKVLLPISQKATQAGAGEERPAQPGGDLGQGGLILVVDDEESVRSVTKMMLERAGYRVLTAADGREGVDAFAQHHRELKLVLLDMTMPHLNGEDAFGEMRRIDPGVPVVLASGYNEQDATTRFSGKGLAGFIQKPFRMQKLLDKVGRAIQGQP